MPNQSVSDNSQPEQLNKESDATGRSHEDNIVNSHVQAAVDQLTSNESRDASESFDTFLAWTRSPVR